MQSAINSIEKLGKQILTNSSKTLDALNKTKLTASSPKIIQTIENAHSTLLLTQDYISKIQKAINENDIGSKLLQPFFESAKALHKHNSLAIKSIEESKMNIQSDTYLKLASVHLEKASASLTLVCDLSRTMHASLTMPLDHINTPPELDQPHVTGYGDHANKSRDYFGKRKF